MYFEREWFIFGDIVESDLVVGAGKYEIVTHKLQIDDICVIVDVEDVR